MNEFVLANALEIRGSVAGTVVYHAGEEDLPDSSRALKGAARQRMGIIHSAFARLQENAARLGADGVIGVKIVHRPLEKDLYEYTVAGTAVAGSAPGLDVGPMVCTLMAQEYTLLRSSGYKPVGVAFGVSVYFQGLHKRVQQEVEKKVNTERSDFTRGLYTARQNAFAALHLEAVKLGAVGVLDIKVHTERTLKLASGYSQGMLIELTAVGTAVVSCPGADLQTDPVMPLNT